MRPNSLSACLLASVLLSPVGGGASAQGSPQGAPQGTPAPGASDPARLELVAEFPHQVTGVTVAKDGRIFVNFPRWTEDSPVSVAEVMKDGTIRAFPDDPWNAWRNARKEELDPKSHFVCVQSVVVDPQGALWVLDPAAPAQGYVVPGGAKLVQIDLVSNKAVRTISFDEGAAPQGSYLNDVRFSPDGSHAYITDSGAKGALVVVDLKTGRSRRVLDGHPSTQIEKGVQVKADGEVLRRPDGRGVEFAADGIALSADGRTLYWQAIKGRTLYSIPTAALENARAAAAEIEGQVKTVGENGVADGLLVTRRGDRMIITAPEEDALKVRVLTAAPESRPTVLVKDKALRWPDTLAEGPDGAIYVTTSRIQDSALFKADAPKSLTTQLWRVQLGGTEATGSLTQPSPAKP